MISSRPVRIGKAAAGWIAIAVFAVVLAGCTSSPRFVIKSQGGGGNESSSMSSEEGNASYYADDFNGKKTASGEVYDMNGLTAAHRTIPFNSKVKVTNVANGKSVVVRVNDRGPFKADRIIDLSLGAAKQIGMIGPGTIRVHLDVIEMGSDSTAK